MRINLPHARELALELSAIPHPTVPSFPSTEGSFTDLHHSLSHALDTYARNLSLVSHVTENLSSVALDNIAHIEAEDAHLAAALERLT